MSQGRSTRSRLDIVPGVASPDRLLRARGQQQEISPQEYEFKSARSAQPPTPTVRSEDRNSDRTVSQASRLFEMMRLRNEDGEPGNSRQHPQSPRHMGSHNSSTHHSASQPTLKYPAMQSTLPFVENENEEATPLAR